ncbi:CCR4-associated factor 4-like protein, partial [Bienertia sinuspersici]
MWDRRGAAYWFQIVFGAGKQGMIYMWDLRGGRTAAAFQSHKEAYHPPLASVKVSSLLEKIESLKAQSDIVPKDIHSINLDPSSSHRLAFHLDDGWSAVLDIHTLEVTHIHCPPPAWLTGSEISNLSYLMKPTWLSTNSIYAVGSSSDKGIHLLDFYPDPSSPCHVERRCISLFLSAIAHTTISLQLMTKNLDPDFDFAFCFRSSEELVNASRRNGFVPLSEDVSACAAHPLNGFIVAGT